jgi:hypothetical protein
MPASRNVPLLLAFRLLHGLASGAYLTSLGRYSGRSEADALLLAAVAAASSLAGEPPARGPYPAR